MRLLLLLQLLLLAGAGRGQSDPPAFSLRELPGLYMIELGRGRAACAPSISIAAGSPTVPTSALALDRARCRTGALRLDLAPPTDFPDGVHVRAGRVSQALSCGALRVPAGAALQFVRAPESLEHDVGSETFRFERGRRYLVLAEQCVFLKILSGVPDAAPPRAPWPWLGPLLALLVLVAIAVGVLCVRRAGGPHPGGGGASSGGTPRVSPARTPTKLDPLGGPLRASLSDPDLPPSPPPLIRPGEALTRNSSTSSPGSVPLRPVARYSREFAAVPPPPSLPPPAQLAPPPPFTPPPL